MEQRTAVGRGLDAIMGYVAIVAVCAGLFMALGLTLPRAALVAAPGATAVWISLTRVRRARRANRAGKAAKAARDAQAVESLNNLAASDMMRLLWPLLSAKYGLFEVAEFGGCRVAEKAGKKYLVCAFPMPAGEPPAAMRVATVHRLAKEWGCDALALVTTKPVPSQMLSWLNALPQPTVKTLSGEELISIAKDLPDAPRPRQSQTATLLGGIKRAAFAPGRARRYMAYGTAMLVVGIALNAGYFTIFGLLLVALAITARAMERKAATDVFS